MVNKNIIKTFFGFKTSKERILSLTKILLILMNKALRHWKNFKIYRISKGKEVNKLW